MLGSDGLSSYLGELLYVFGAVKGALGINGLINIALGLLVAAALYIVQRRARATIAEVVAAVRGIEASVDRVRNELQITLEQVDKSIDAVTKRLEYIKRDIDSNNEDVANEIASGVARKAEDQTSKREAQMPNPLWRELQQLWSATKDEVRQELQRVADNISDGRRRRRYEDFNQKYFDSIIYRLYEDNWISEETTNALLEMDTMFNSRRNQRRPVTAEDIRQFRQWREPAFPK